MFYCKTLTKQCNDIEIGNFQLIKFFNNFFFISPRHLKKCETMNLFDQVNSRCRLKKKKNEQEY